MLSRIFPTEPKYSLEVSSDKIYDYQIRTIYNNGGIPNFKDPHITALKAYLFF